MAARRDSVAFVRGPAAASHARAVASALDGEPMVFDSLEEVFESVQKEDARFAVVTLGSPAAGATVTVYGLLLEYDLRIVMERIESTPEADETLLVLAKPRSAALSRGKIIAARYKTLLAISIPPDGASRTATLHCLLGAFASRRVEIINIDSRERRSLGRVHAEWMLYVDIEGCDDDERVIQTLADVREVAPCVRVLGSYPAAFNQSADDDVWTLLNPNEGAIGMASMYPLNPVVTGIPLGANLVMFGMAKQMEAAGVKVHSLCIGETDFAPPDRAIDEGVRALKARSVRYAPMRGDPTLRELIATYLETVKGVTYDAETEIQVTAGAQQALYHALYTLVRPGDKVVLPSPYWAAYEAMIRQVRAGLVRLRCEPQEEYLINPAALQDALTANPTAKVLMLCNPSNPAGTLHSPAHLERIAEVLRKPQFRHVVVIADEIYEQIVYQDAGEPRREHRCFASLPGMRERTIVINGFSKAYAMAGLRVGFLAAPRYFVDQCMVLQAHLTSSANTIGQLAAAEALREELELFAEGEARIAPALKELDEKRQYIARRLRAIPNVKFAYPTAAFYLFMDLSAYFDGKRAFVAAPDADPTAKQQTRAIRDVVDFCEFLLREHHVALSPGVDFGEEFGIRISYAGKMEAVVHGMDALEHALQTLSFERVYVPASVH